MFNKIGEANVTKMLFMLKEAVTKIPPPAQVASACCICCPCCTTMQEPPASVIEAFETAQLQEVEKAIAEINRSVLPAGMNATVLFYGALKAVLLEVVPTGGMWTGSAPAISAAELSLADMQSKALHGESVDAAALDAAFDAASKEIDSANEAKQAAYLAANPQMALLFQHAQAQAGTVAANPQMALLFQHAQAQAGTVVAQQPTNTMNQLPLMDGMVASMAAIAMAQAANPYVVDASPGDPFAMKPFMVNVPEAGSDLKSMVVEAPTGSMISITIPEDASPGYQVLVLPPLAGEMVATVLASEIDAEGRAELGIDTDGDGVADTFRKVALIDTDGDGTFDVAQWE